MDRFHIGVCVRRLSLDDPLIGALWASIVNWRPIATVLWRDSP
jgi:hypothetical protein